MFPGRDETPVDATPQAPIAGGRRGRLRQAGVRACRRRDAHGPGRRAGRPQAPAAAVSGRVVDLGVGEGVGGFEQSRADRVDQSVPTGVDRGCPPVRGGGPQARQRRGHRGLSTARSSPRRARSVRPIVESFVRVRPPPGAPWHERPCGGGAWTSTAGRRPCRDQYSPLITKNEPRMVPASFDFCLANLNREASSAGTSIPSESLNPTARLPASSTAYRTLTDRPLS